MPLGAELKASLTSRVHRQIMPRAQAALERELDRNVPRDTGKLARTRRVRVQHTPTRSVITVAYPTALADITEAGPGPHVIRPRRRKALRFRVGGRVVFARRVHWRPGPGVRRNKGWFSRSTSAAAWARIIREALR